MIKLLTWKRVFPCAQNYTDISRLKDSVELNKSGRKKKATIFKFRKVRHFSGSLKKPEYFETDNAVAIIFHDRFLV